MKTEQSGTKKYIWGIVLIAIVIIGVSIWSGNQKAAPEKAVNPETATPATEAARPTEEEVQPEEITSAWTPKTVAIQYTDQGFLPASVSIKIGDTVKFVNKSEEPMWVGSNEHPTHTLYNGTSLREHCPDTAGTAFDQCGRGNEYSFIFNKAGEWEYHNHANPSKGGLIIVKK